MMIISVFYWIQRIVIIWQHIYWYKSINISKIWYLFFFDDIAATSIFITLMRFVRSCFPYSFPLYFHASSAQKFSRIYIIYIYIYTHITYIKLLSFRFLRIVNGLLLRYSSRFGEILRSESQTSRQYHTSELSSHWSTSPPFRSPKMRIYMPLSPFIRIIMLFLAR